MGLRFQKRFNILPGLRLNLSKSGVSASVGPRGADVNIGRHGVSANAGIPGTGLSYRSRLGRPGGVLGVLAVIAGLGFWAFQHWGANVPAPTSRETAPRANSVAPAAVQPAGTPSIRYVHRGGSDLRETERESGKRLKKEPKGARLTVLLTDGDWTKVQDGSLTGWMRSSVLGADPPK
jgi:hypothetical protein